MAEKTAEQLQAEIEALQEKYRDLEENHNSLKVEKADLLKEVMKKKGTIETLQSKIEQAQKSITDKETSVAGELQTLKVQNVDLQTQLKAATSKVGELEKGETLNEAIRRVGGAKILPTVYRKLIDVSKLNTPEEFDGAVKGAFDALNNDIKSLNLIDNPDRVVVAQTSVQDGVTTDGKPPEEYDFGAKVRERQARR